MDRVQEKQFKLLSELDGVLRSENIPYILAGGIAVNASRGEEPGEGQYDFTLLVSARGASRLVKALRSGLPKDRALECMELDPLLPSWDIRYIDLSTTFMDTGDVGSSAKAGISVTVRRYFHTSKSKLMRKARTAVGILLDRTNPAFGKTGGGGLVKLALKLFKIPLKLLGRASVVRMSLRLLSSVSARSALQTAYVRRFGAKNLLIPRHYIEYPAPAELGGLSLRQSPWQDAFLKAYYGKALSATEQPPKLYKKATLIADADTPYTKYTEWLLPLVDRSRRERELAEVNKAKTEMEPLRAYCRELWRILRRTDRRMTLVTEYAGRTDEARELYEKGDFKALSELLADYYAGVFSVPDGELDAMVFDNELHAIAMKSMRECGQFTLAEKYGIKAGALGGETATARSVLLQLLAELDSICSQNGLTYILARHTALEAIRGGALSPNATVASVIMPWKDAAKFKQIVRATMPERRIEGIEDDPCFPNMALRYSDPSTTMIFTPEIGRLSSYGISVEIERARLLPRNPLTKKLYRLLEMGLLVNASWSKAATRGGEAKLVSIAGKRLVSSVLRRVYAPKHTRREYFVCRYPSGSKSFAPSYFENRAECRVDRCTFSVPKSKAGYLKKEFGAKYASVSLTGYRDTRYLTVLDARRPFAVYYADMAKRFFDADMARPRRLWYYGRYRMRRYQQRVNGYWDLLFRTDDRFKLWQEYAPQKDELMELAAAGEYAELTDRFKNYFALVEKNMKKGLALSFDPDIHAIALKLYRGMGKRAFAAKLDRRMPRAYKTALRRGGHEHD